MKFYLALWLAKIINVLISLVSRDRGTNLPGEKALIFDPMFVKHFKNIDCNNVIFVTGTNGKSSSTNLIVHILRKSGKKVISNLEGANLLAGIATSLAKEASLTGRLNADYFVFETDERYLPLIYAQLPAKNLMITNLQKDQVQRNGDPDFIVRKLKEIINPQMRLILNNEEPRSRAFDQISKDVIYYGVDHHQESFKKSDDYPSMACPICFHDIEFKEFHVDNVGPFICHHCGYKSMEKPAYYLENIDYGNKTFAMGDISFKMPYDLPFMLYNYSAAVAVCEGVCGVSKEKQTKAFDSFKNIGGRFEILHYKGKTIKYMRIKQENPDTLQSALNIVASDSQDKMLALGLYKLCDFVPDYANTFYAFDCDFGPLVKSSVERYLCFSEHVAFDTANRLIYEGVDRRAITIMNSDVIPEIFAEIEKAKTDNVYLITWLSTFEKMKKFIEGGAF
ncbi:MurT ligase domain-containing protein [Eubacteriaceae bacterium ES3]|nr:MurT ligase domain-containing protein [Eubacteriaceae bacterium ES3]